MSINSKDPEQNLLLPPTPIAASDNLSDGIETILQAIPRITNTFADSVGVATKEQIDNVVSDLIKKEKKANTSENYHKTLVTLAYMCQLGATSRKFLQSRKIREFGLNITVGNFIESCKKHDTTPRKFARAIRNEIIKVATHFNLEGNLAKTYKLDFPSHEKQDLIWVSDFQTFSDNPAMPTHVSQWLLENYKKRFRPDLAQKQDKKNS